MSHIIVKRYEPEVEYKPNSLLEFKIRLKNVAIIEEDNIEKKVLNKDKIEEACVRALAEYPARLRGMHVSFIQSVLRMNNRQIEMMIDGKFSEWAQNTYGTCIKWRYERDLRIWLELLINDTDDKRLGELVRKTRTSRLFEKEYAVIYIDSESYEIEYK